jgi:hypothetical protein
VKIRSLIIPVLLAGCASHEKPIPNLQGNMLTYRPAQDVAACVASTVAGSTAPTRTATGYAVTSSAPGRPSEYRVDTLNDPEQPYRTRVTIQGQLRNEDEQVKTVACL